MSVHRLQFDPRSNYVYAMYCRDGDGPGYVKFGMSGDIGHRLTSLRTNCPIPAQWFAIADVHTRDMALSAERGMHRAFRSRLLTGEWYRFTFDDPADRAEFKKGTQLVLIDHMRRDPAWSYVDVEKLDEANRQRRINFLRSKHRRKIEARAQWERARQKAWRELEEYGST